jgi:ribosomal-protein-alanine N-acetyltransferase
VLVKSLQRPNLRTERLQLWAFDGEDIQRLIDLRVEQLEHEIGVTFPHPFAPPPLMSDALAHLRDQTRLQPTNLLGRTWFFASKVSNSYVGAGGFFSTDGGATLSAGYAVYPEYQGRGYATEAMRALFDLAWSYPDVRVIQASISPSNTASVRVATKLNMQIVGIGSDPDVGTIQVYEISR